MNTVQKVDRAIEIAQAETGRSFSYHTDDDGKVIDIFVWNPPSHSQRIHGPFSGSSMKEIVSRLKNLVK